MEDRTSRPQSKWSSFMAFYGYFAAAYGTCWFVGEVLALVTQSHIELGMFAFFGFPAVGMIYAIARMCGPKPEMHLRERIGRLEAEIALLRSRLSSQ